MDTEPIYLALYKGKGSSRLSRLQDGLIRLMTHGKYSHCEIVVFKQEFEIGERYPVEWVDCYSSSPRDGGVRCKSLPFIDKSKWELILLPNLTEKQVYHYFQQTKGKAYDWCGVLGLFLGLRQNQNKFFCSEWCYNLIFDSQQGWRFSPNQLAEMARALPKHQGENYDYRLY